ncbi:hypothetical protein K493DRAFT_412903 [Basidiobolus meristosporus CBS 931.73]|uniref:Anaphase-promoting complex subunit 5 n=1 Tax=Basidiobolus meristosporus CBS 931.73 TaxID=1314790 RepID=A0A1Y1VTE1_9FUNG|nr:hypothetical protein K493DRAFT_412903 [Basidiobolus meristosporus CBS 931.73]|eukprot:ORX64004.1 hypothetical protein K493DRAFT_412903 [Basidiobolus meristosporus CBS 931.73]
MLSSWLYRLERTRSSSKSNDDKNSEMTKIDSLIEKSKQLNLTYIQTMCELSKARLALEVKHDPVECFESLIKSSSLNINNGLQGIVGTTDLMYASAWSVYGSAALSSLYTQLQITYHEKDVVADDAAIGHCKLAYQHALQGQYDQAIEILDAVKEQFGHEHGALFPWAQCLGQILHQRAYFREERLVASSITRWLRTVMDENTPMGTDAEYRDVLNGLQCGDVVRAVGKLYAMIDGSTEHSNTTIRHQNQTQYLLKFAEYHLKSGNPIPALPLVLTCLTLSEKFHVMEDLYMTQVRLAEIFLCLGMAERAIEIIDRIMSQVLSTGSLHLQSTTHLLYAKGQYAQLLALEKEGKVVGVELESILKFLQKANAGFERLECLEERLECAYLQSRIYHQMGLIAERNKFAKVYRKLKEGRDLAMRSFEHDLPLTV